jgi:hypothetical protein
MESQLDTWDITRILSFMLDGSALDYIAPVK